MSSQPQLISFLLLLHDFGTFSTIESQFQGAILRIIEDDDPNDAAESDDEEDHEQDQDVGRKKFVKLVWSKIHGF